MGTVSDATPEWMLKPLDWQVRGKPAHCPICGGRFGNDIEEEPPKIGLSPMENAKAELTPHDLEFEAERAVPYEEFGKMLWLGEIVRIGFAKDDVGVLMFKDRLPMAAHARIKDLWRAVMGERRLLILDSGTKIGVVSFEDESDG